MQGRSLVSTTQPNPHASKHASGDLIRRIASGEQGALAELYDESSRFVYGLALRIIKDPCAAEEVSHDVYLQVWRQADRYQEARGDVFSWLFTLTRSRAIDRLRSAGMARRKLHAPLEAARSLASEAGGPDEDLALSDRRKVVRAALMKLSPEQREVISIAYFQGLSHSEIAERLDLPLGTVKTRIRQGMITLRAMLAGWNGETPRGPEGTTPDGMLQGNA